MRAFPDRLCYTAEPGIREGGIARPKFLRKVGVRHFDKNLQCKLAQTFIGSRFDGAINRSQRFQISVKTTPLERAHHALSTNAHFVEVSFGIDGDAARFSRPNEGPNTL